MKALRKLGLLFLLSLLLLSGFFTINKEENPSAILAGIVHDLQENEWIASVLAEDKLDVLSEKSARGEAYREIQQMLDAWSKAVGSQNPQQMDNIMEHSGQENMAQRLAMAPILDVRIKLKGAGNLIQNGAECSLKGLKTEVKYRYRGGKKSEWYTMERSFDVKQTEQGMWKVTRYIPIDSPAFFEIGETKTKKTENFLFLYHDKNENDMPAIMEKTERAYVEIGRRLSIKGNPPYPVLVYPEENLWQGGHTVATASGQYFLNAAGYKVTNQFISLNFEALQNSSQDGSVYTTLKHEIVHLYQFPQLPPYVPVWLMEGMAMYYSDDNMSYVFDGESGQRRLREINLSSLTASERLGENGFGVNGRKQQQEYAFSYNTVRYIVEMYGEDTLQELIASYSNTPWYKIKDDIPFEDKDANYKWKKVTTRLTDEYLEKHLGINEHELEARVKRWISDKNTN
ncbi:hypothetical protein [Aneurinibacillus aneurinilyticus]|jgi:hypothetical protein|uniref:Uncharacterized protein n=2 Tax=Aneurinibacillus aneurinilyticus TaxID=1391 RepID=A0A848CP83_ANEAE|nr:hypothetical protein [Aneurinibacillus aneurinilyticus]ERI10060.1 hypothetical protein HMPREF0083_01821 [Aneurinibacillus aneurinilyticus ATCC 12856]MCI1693030.1 hypothetical protein [Aneurinibacillus aneurinilyticus]MED0669927.1 hypothetical protein [Aneurinibacillus aneurinilyticus]MED0708095.1 hypothetical protein [Aneurinibacillus aneurinilyticus]MED0726031.1 hypothetical protein [Aneurinibacillus aneurinilyticus]